MVLCADSRYSAEEPTGGVRDRRVGGPVAAADARRIESALVRKIDHAD